MFTRKHTATATAARRMDSAGRARAPFRRVIALLIGAVHATGAPLGVAQPAQTPQSPAQRNAPGVAASSATAPDVAKDALSRFGEDEAATPPPISFRPWAEGVSEENQTAGRALFQEGNALLHESLFSKAIEKYQAALERWDHPAIHYNHALALSTLDQPLKTLEELVAALRYGAGPLGEDEFQQAQRYKILVEKQLVQLIVECDSAQAIVTLNGKPLFTAPGRFEGVVLPGEQFVKASREGYIPDERTLTLIPGKPTQVRLAVYTEEQLTQYERLWPEYPPWLVVGAGAVIAGVGGYFYLSGERAGDDYGALSNQCAASRAVSYDGGGGGATLTSYDGCRVGTATGDRLQNLEDQARLENTLGIGMLAAGGVVLATGAVLVYVNRARPYQLKPQDVVGQNAGFRWSAGVTSNAAYVSGRGTF